MYKFVNLFILGWKYGVQICTPSCLFYSIFEGIQICIPYLPVLSVFCHYSEGVQICIPSRRQIIAFHLLIIGKNSPHFQHNVL